MTALKGIVLDRDGTIIKHVHYLGDPSKVELNKDILFFLDWCKSKNIKLFIHSNQSGVHRGYFSFNDLMKVHISMMQKLENFNFLKVFYALDFKSRFRKPKSILKYLKRYNISRADEIVYIGDSDVDFETAKNIGSKCFLLDTGLNKPTYKTFSNYKEILKQLNKNLNYD